MNVTVVTKLRRLLVEAHPSTTVFQLKQQLELILGVPVTSQTLSIHGIDLIDGFDLEFYDVHEGMQINLSVASGTDRFQICIKISTRRLCLEVSALDTVAYLKEKIQVADGTPAERLTLFHMNMKLEDNYCLGEYGISELSEIITVAKPMPRSKVVVMPPNRWLRFIVQTSSAFNSMDIPLEMNDSSSIREVRQLLLGRGILPPDDYFFIHKQRIMKDNQNLRWHGVRNGDTLHVFNGTVSHGHD
ncbi:hypothetical protein ACLOJK_039487 [Asimina triloba]